MLDLAGHTGREGDRTPVRRRCVLRQEQLSAAEHPFETPVKPFLPPEPNAGGRHHVERGVSQATSPPSAMMCSPGSRVSSKTDMMVQLFWVCTTSAQGDDVTVARVCTRSARV